MRAGSKLVLTIIAAFMLHWIVYSVLADPAATGDIILDPLVSSLFLNLAGIPIGIFLGKTGSASAGTRFPGFARPFVTVLVFWVFIFGFLAAAGLLIGKFTTDAIRESGETPQGTPGFRPSFSLPPVLSLRMHR